MMNLQLIYLWLILCCDEIEITNTHTHTQHGCGFIDLLDTLSGEFLFGFIIFMKGSKKWQTEDNYFSVQVVCSYNFML